MNSNSIFNAFFDADLNSLSNIDDADIKAGANIQRNKLASGTANYVLINDGSGVFSEEQFLDKSRGGAGADMSAVTFPSTGTLATLAGTEQLTNKDIDGTTASNTSRITLPADTTANLDLLTDKEATLWYDTTLDIPVFNDGTNNIPLITASSLSTLTIEEEGVAVETDVTVIDFVGENITATQTAPNNVQISVVGTTIFHAYNRSGFSVTSGAANIINSGWTVQQDTRSCWDGVDDCVIQEAGRYLIMGGALFSSTMSAGSLMTVEVRVDGNIQAHSAASVMNSSYIRQPLPRAVAAVNLALNQRVQLRVSQNSGVNKTLDSGSASGRGNFLTVIYLGK